MTPAAPAAAMLYIGQQVLLSLAFYLLLRLAMRPSVLSPATPAAKVESLRRSYLAGPPLYLVTMFVAWSQPRLAMGISLALWVFWAVVPSQVASRRSN
jgi:hypothetical protein